MKTFLEPWVIVESVFWGRPQFVIRDSAGVWICSMPLDMYEGGLERARRIVACVNALRTLPTEQIERCVTDPPDYWLPVYDSVRSSTLLRIQDAPAPTRMIEYDPAQVEVEGAELEGLAGEPIRLTHEEAAQAMRSQWPAFEGEL